MLVLLLLLAGLSQPLRAQQRKPSAPRVREGAAKGPGKDFFRRKSPTIRYVRPDTTTTIETEELPDDNSDASKSIYFNPAKKLSIVSEDTTSINEGDGQIVEMSDEVLIDSSWVKVAGYYSIWDTHNINPYRVDGRHIRDSIKLKLVDPLAAALRADADEGNAHHLGLRLSGLPLALRRGPGSGNRRLCESGF